jgi:hypothetical protein
MSRCKINNSTYGCHCDSLRWEFFGAFAELRKASITFVVSVGPSAWSCFSPTERTFMKFDTWAFFENLLKKFKFHYKLTNITSTLHEDQYTFVIISRSFLLRMTNISDRNCRENKNTQFVFNNFFFPRKLCRLQDNVEKYCRPGQATAGYLTLQTHTQNMQYVMLFYSNSGCTRAPLCCVTLTLPVLL